VSVQNHVFPPAEPLVAPADPPAPTLYPTVLLGVSVTLLEAAKPPPPPPPAPLAADTERAPPPPPIASILLSEEFQSAGTFQVPEPVEVRNMTLVPVMMCV